MEFNYYSSDAGSRNRSKNKIDKEENQEVNLKADQNQRIKVKEECLEIMDLRDDPIGFAPEDTRNTKTNVYPSPMHSDDMQHKIALVMKEREHNKQESNLRIPTEEDEPQEDVRIGFENVPKKRLKKKKILRIDKSKNNIELTKETPITEAQMRIPEQDEIVERSPNISQVKISKVEPDSRQHPLENSVERVKLKKKKKKKAFDFQEVDKKDFNDVNL